MSTAVLLIAHGSRRAEANADLLRLADLLRPRLPGQRVEIAYLELAEPTIPAGLEHCRAGGAREIQMLPWFLSAGSHVTDDLTQFRDEFRASHPEVSVTLHPPLGLHPLMVDILLARLGEAF
ncbi:MAG: CbiX/SirB N-terminal domain-containing protein [Gemmataceae bacterium]|nr:CbiX/SirB N-terminal domain-containing protein [Gemmataceae bacterium]